MCGLLWRLVAGPVSFSIERRNDSLARSMHNARLPAGKMSEARAAFEAVLADRRQAIRLAAASIGGVGSSGDGGTATAAGTLDIMQLAGTYSVATTESGWVQRRRESQIDRVATESNWRDSCCTGDFADWSGCCLLLGSFTRSRRDHPPCRHSQRAG